LPCPVPLFLRVRCLIQAAVAISELTPGPSGSCATLTCAFRFSLRVLPVGSLSYARIVQLHFGKESQFKATLAHARFSSGPLSALLPESVLFNINTLAGHREDTFPSKRFAVRQRRR